METLNTETKDKWYTLKVLSNFEDRVKKLIEKKLETEPESCNYFYEVLMPSEVVTSVVKGKKKARVRKLYPGYLFVRMNIFNECLKFLDTRVALDQNGFKFDIFEH